MAEQARARPAIDLGISGFTKITGPSLTQGRTGGSEGRALGLNHLFYPAIQVA
ncbi:hypothetical protein [Streptomyces sp. NPDC014734]|uniref:hypothetical protein n=1 Tax=Streptomyces sp. NPDC014734 TaxID=3364886 RepID=UPI0036F62AAC